jgi:hypothetical protein
VDYHHDSFVEDLASAPFHIVAFACIWVFILGFNTPKSFRHKFLDFFCLIDTESQGRSLTRSIRQFKESSLLDMLHQLIGLQSRESYSDLEV